MAVGAIAAIYAVVLWIFPSDVFWSPDEGGKFLQMSGWRAGGPSAYQISYPGHANDPEYQFYPTRAMYPQPSAGGTVNTAEECGIPLPDAWLRVGIVGVGLCILSCAPLKRWRFWLWTIGALAVGWVSWKAAILPDRYRAVHSLLLPAPFLLLALLPLPQSTPRPPARVFLQTVTLLYLGCFLFLAFSICGVQGGAEWGTRYALVQIGFRLKGGG